ncbi:hypothetical protein ACEWY4_017571 [Coilia grayii]|uniref:Exonuclease domain-containing protein n=1 Tax=Coilia grayii TaxID=363190 RepID=A0ABD1JH80_9TELE
MAGDSERKRGVSPVSEDSAKRLKTESRTQPPKSKGQARVTRCFERLHEVISLSDLSSLLQCAALGKSVIAQPSWCHLHHQRKLSGVNVTILEDVTQVHFYRFYPQFKNLRRRYKTRCTLLPCAGDVSSFILNSKLSCSGTVTPEPSTTLLPTTASLSNTPTCYKDKDLRWHPVIRTFGSETRGLSAYVLTGEEMSKHSFPLQGAPDCKSFVCTGKNGHVTDSSPLYGLDCEMCLTKAGLEVTRVSLVDDQGQCMLDELVKPDNPIHNYHTRFSGITKDMLEPITTRLCDVQSKLIELLPEDAVLVGHSLDCDLRALQMIHPNVIDTSLLYRRECGMRFKLKLLAEVILEKEIQSEEKKGHDPTEDAVAAVQLAQYFISKGPRQVVELHQEELWGLPITFPGSPVNGFSHKNLSVTRLLDSLNSGTSSSPSTSHLTFSHALFKTGQPALQLGRLAGSDSQPSNNLWRRQSCSSDRKVLEALRRQVQSHPLSLLQLSAYSQLLTHTHPTYTHRSLHKLVCGLREMCVVYVGPLWPDCTERDVKRLCSSCGALRSVRLLSSTHWVHAVVEYEVLEGAVLALERLKGCTQVQRPVGEFTLDLEQYLHDLREDPVNERVIYAAGVANDDQMADLQVTLGHVEGHVESVSFRPQQTSKRKRRKKRHAFIKLDSTEAMEASLEPLAELGPGQVKLCRALTPPHLCTWAPDGPLNPQSSEEAPQSAEACRGDGEEDGREEENGVDEEVEAEVDRKTAGVMRKLDSKVGKILDALPDNTLSIVILPGKQSFCGVSQPGLCFIEVKQEAAPSP